MNDPSPSPGRCSLGIGISTSNLDNASPSKGSDGMLFAYGLRITVVLIPKNNS